jgi:hypothetical protein
MRSRLWILLAAAMLALPAAAQQPPRPQEKESLAEAARRAREKKQERPRAERVLTNDDLEGRRGAVSVVGGEQPADARPDDGEVPEEETEEHWRKKFAAARDDLRMAERELDVLQRELNRLLLQYEDDPNEALRQQYSRERVNEHTLKIEEQRKTVAARRAALDALTNELRRRGLPPGWSREQ